MCRWTISTNTMTGSTSAWPRWAGCFRSKELNRCKLYLIARYWDSPLVTDQVRDEVVTAVTNVSLFYAEPG